KGGLDLKVQIDSPIARENGRVLVFNTNDHNALAHNYAGTVHKAQGQGAAEVFHLANLSMADNQSSLVAFTRLTGGDYRLYGTEEEVERLAERLGMDRVKGTALQAGLKKQEHALDDSHAAWIERQRKTLAARLRRVEPNGVEVEGWRRRQHQQGAG